MTPLSSRMAYTFAQPVQQKVSSPDSSPHRSHAMSGRHNVAPSRQAAKKFVSVFFAFFAGWREIVDGVGRRNRLPYFDHLRIRLLGFDVRIDRKSTRLNSSHLGISYAVFCLKK